MPTMRSVALLIETSRAYGRGLVRGAARYNREHGQWLTYFQPHGLDDPLPEWLSVRKIAEEFARLFGKQVTFTGAEAPDAFLSNGRLGYELLGSPTVDAEQMIRWIADWQLRGGPTLGKPTHFQTRNGKF